MPAVTPKSKVRFGVSNLTFWPLTADGTAASGSAQAANPTYGAAITVPGTVTIEVKYESNEVKFYADNSLYYSAYSKAGNNGTIENAVFPNALKAAAYGWRVDANGGLVEVEDGKPGRFAMAYQVEGDEDAVRVVHYDVSLGLPRETHQTTEDNITVNTESIDYSGKGQLIGGERVPRYSIAEGGTGYNAWFTAPVFPAAAV